MGVPEILSKIPFYVEQASYCVGLHEKATCPRCTPEGCPKLEEAAGVLATFRAERAKRRSGSTGQGSL